MTKERRSHSGTPVFRSCTDKCVNSESFITCILSFLFHTPTCIVLCLLQDAIVIHEVYEEGAAAKDGRLWAGDQILEVILPSRLPLLEKSSRCICCLCVQVNGVDLRGASHEEAIAALRQTPAKVRLTILRDEAQDRDEENLDVFEVELQKRSGRGLGLSIVGKRSTC